MALPFNLTEDAVKDIEEAVQYIALDSSSAANRLADELEQSFYFLGQFPSAGHPRKDLTFESELRFWTAAGYTISYYADRSPIVIISVLHGSRDIASLLSERIR